MQISFNVTSIHLNDSVISRIKSSNMIKLNLIEKPQLIQQEYIINHPQGLYCINHDFKFKKSQNPLKEIILTVRKVEKKWCFENLFMINIKKDDSKINNTIDPLIGKPNKNSDTNIQYKYEQLANSLLGFCKINLENLEKGVNNKITAEIITKKDLKVIGHANIEVYMWDEDKIQTISQNNDICSQKIFFEDPDC